MAAWIGFTLPSAALLIALGLFASTTDLSNAGWVHGLKLAAVAVVALAVVTMAQTLTPDWPRRAIALLALAVALLVTVPLTQLAVIAGGAVAGYLFLHAPPATAQVAEASPVSRRTGVALIAALVVLVVGLPVATAVTQSSTVALLQGILDSGALVFGGGHVVLPLLHATTVDPGFVSENQFLAGYGAAQAVPGPLFTFAAFLGTVTSVPPAGVLGGVLCLVGIFVPSFLMIWGALPFWDDLRRSERFRRALMGTNAAVVGLLGAALYNPVWISSVSTWLDFAIAAVAFVVLATRRVPPILVVAGCAIAAQFVSYM